MPTNGYSVTSAVNSAGYWIAMFYGSYLAGTQTLVEQICIALLTLVFFVIIIFSLGIKDNRIKSMPFSGW